MANRRGYFERDSRGRERVIIERRPSRRRSGSGSHARHRSTNDRELLIEAQEREALLTASIQQLSAENQQLRRELSLAQRDQWTLQNLQAEHHRCHNLRAQLQEQGNVLRRLELKLEVEQDKTEELRGRIRRGSSAEATGYRQRYEEKAAEVELLRRRMAEQEELVRMRLAEQDELMRLSQVRLEDKGRLVNYLRGVLADYGIRVTR